MIYNLGILYIDWYYSIWIFNSFKIRKNRLVLLHLQHSDANNSDGRCFSSARDERNGNGRSGSDAADGCRESQDEDRHGEYGDGERFVTAENKRQQRHAVDIASGQRAARRAGNAEETEAREVHDTAPCRLTCDRCASACVWNLTNRLVHVWKNANARTIVKDSYPEPP